MPFFGHMPHVPFGVRFPALAYSPFRWLHGSHRGLLIPPSRRALGATTQRPLSLAHATLSPQAATVYTSNRGIYFGPSTKYTNSPTDRVAESPDAHRRVVPRGGLRSELPDRVGCETLHLGVEDYCDKYSQVAHENRNSDFFSMRQAQVNELRYLVCDTLSLVPLKIPGLTIISRFTPRSGTIIGRKKRSPRQGNCSQPTIYCTKGILEPLGSTHYYAS